MTTSQLNWAWTKKSVTVAVRSGDVRRQTSPRLSLSSRRLVFVCLLLIRLFQMKSQVSLQSPLGWIAYWPVVISPPVVSSRLSDLSLALFFLLLLLVCVLNGWTLTNWKANGGNGWEWAERGFDCARARRLFGVHQVNHLCSLTPFQLALLAPFFNLLWVVAQVGTESLNASTMTTTATISTFFRTPDDVFFILSVVYLRILASRAKSKCTQRKGEKKDSQ